MKKGFVVIFLSKTRISVRTKKLSSIWVFMSWEKQEKGRPLPKFGEWDVNDPASAEGFTVIFNKARDEKKTGGKPESPGKADPNIRHGVEPGRPPSKKWFCCIHQPPAES
ncbi:PREDICTED: RPM1-interacting 4 [Prunus dulcis]|uniref:PREDICTED: RPM1-interacting 4 n=1 Tax=Prunus dulcis TaxID=3755 RepID=A0A5E4ETF1_PRUDU|nr:PREDICTED: RPM1-interacting 4 [Prunus dulcis]